MSHFTVLVAVSNGDINTGKAVEDIIHAKLLPYMENCCAEPPKEYMEFYDESDLVLNDWKNGTATVVIFPDGTAVLEHAARAKFIPEHFPDVNFDDLPKEERPFDQVYYSEETFANDWHGYRKDPDTGKYGYWQNPNAKWDWFAIGGRWAGGITLKNGEGADIAQLKDIDLDKLDSWGYVHLDGEWHEKGTMGWWAMSDATDDSRDEFKQHLIAQIEKLDPNDYLVLVDCHI